MCFSSYTDITRCVLYVDRTPMPRHVLWLVYQYLDMCFGSYATDMVIFHQHRHVAEILAWSQLCYHNATIFRQVLHDTSETRHEVIYVLCLFMFYVLMLLRVKFGCQPKTRLPFVCRLMTHD